MIGRISVALIVSVDSFFITLLVSKKVKDSIPILFVSPLFHIIFCSFGFLMQQSLNSFLGKSLLCVVILIILIGGGYLIFVYKPSLKAMQKLRYKQKTGIWFRVILILFCSFDALIAGFIYGYWKIGLKAISIYVGGVNLAVIFCAILIGEFLRRRAIYLSEKGECE